MGILICEIHDESFILSLSDLLDSYIRKEVDIKTVVRLSFSLEGIGGRFLKYCLPKEELFLKTGDIITEKEFSNIVVTATMCQKCFKDFISRNNINIVEKEILIVE